MIKITGKSNVANGSAVALPVNPSHRRRHGSESPDRHQFPMSCANIRQDWWKQATGAGKPGIHQKHLPCSRSYPIAGHRRNYRRLKPALIANLDRPELNASATPAASHSPHPVAQIAILPPEPAVTLTPLPKLAPPETLSTPPVRARSLPLWRRALGSGPWPLGSWASLLGSPFASSRSGLTLRSARITSLGFRRTSCRHVRIAGRAVPALSQRWRANTRRCACP